MTTEPQHGRPLDGLLTDRWYTPAEIRDGTAARAAARETERNQVLAPDRRRARLTGQRLYA